MNDNKGSINYTFKILYALGIIFICAGHCNDGGFSIFYEFFPPYSFHLGLFMFAFGYFYKNKDENNVLNFIWRKVKHLLVPLYLWNFFYGIIIHLIKPFGFFTNANFSALGLNSLFIYPIFHGQQFELNRGGWYIIPLFIVHIANIFARKLFKTLKIEINELVYFTICLGLGALGIFLAKNGYQNHFQLLLCRCLYFVPFYSLGILYKKYEHIDKLNSIAYFSIIITIALFYIFKYGSMPTFLPSWIQFGSNPIKPFVVGILGIALWLRVAKILEPAIGQNKYVNIIANNTYSIMINQFLGMMIVKSVFAFIHINTSLCSNFDMAKYKTDVYYYYLPHNLSQMNIIYLVAGIVFSIYLQKLVTKLYNVLKSKNMSQLTLPSEND